ncbi:hypothetical protein PR048_020328 [Dryococelus australis]|uniref:Uncharacterized protein n=1 Tax=Dryococelus australis TaxID=614101 RepID=A0ABQ9H5Z6_9NEOP|nr:hypothetical protein PR048_020328 [Dryococelus australis]
MGENPIHFLNRFEEYASVFGLTYADMLRCLTLSFRNAAYYLWEINKPATSTKMISKKNPPLISETRKYRSTCGLSYTVSDLFLAEAKSWKFRHLYPPLLDEEFVQNVRNEFYSQGCQGGWRSNFRKNRGQRYRNGWRNQIGNPWKPRRRDSDSDREHSHRSS